MKDLSVQVLSDVTVFTKYSKYMPELNRRETWEEIVLRNMLMHIKQYPQLEGEVRENYKFVLDKKVLPSMRSMQFGGKPIELMPNRQYNCCFLNMDSWEAFHEIMFLLLGGSGVGYSVQKHHVNKLPEIKKPTKRKKRHLIADSIEGWARAVKVLMQAYFFGLSDPEFDFSDIRPKGTLLKTSGGKAPGPQPLKDALHQIRKILDAKEIGDKLSPLETHDAVCHIADAVLSGGIRRAALISLFSFDDEQMLSAKFGNWWDDNPQRARANNSVVLVRHKIKKKDFFDLWKKIKASQAGEPGFYFTNNPELGTNPCAEISLKSMQFCNLTEMNVSNIKTQQELNECAKVAAFIGTLQAGYTNFHFLRDQWKENTEKDALLGVGMTGIASGGVLKLNLEEAAEVVNQENKRVAKLIGIKPAARTTCVKPSGTTSLVLGTSSGIHAWHSPYYIRTMRVLKNESIYTYLKNKMSKLVEDDYFKAHEQAIISFPIKAPSGSIFRTESALDLLNRIKKVSKEWVNIGHKKGDNTHNVSATITLRENEWEEVGEWMWLNKEFYNGLSVLPEDLGSYVQAPFQECTKEKYEELIKYVNAIDLTEVLEYDDATNLKESAACTSGACLI